MIDSENHQNQILTKDARAPPGAGLTARSKELSNSKPLAHDTLAETAP
jgi:hypothetical protein